MSVREFLLVPRFDPRLQVLWQNVLPCEVRVCVLGDGLETLMQYRRAPAAATDPVRMRRWTLQHDGLNGRILRLSFPPDRPDPAPPYDELVGALYAINLAHASAPHVAEPCRLGLAMASKLLLGWLAEDEAVLRAALAPPF